MDIKVSTNISKEYQDIEVCINAPERNEEVQRLENELLSIKDFVRISNSAIININHVKCFNTSIIGKIIIKFKDGSEESVSRKKTSDIMKILKDRSELYGRKK